MQAFYNPLGRVLMGTVTDNDCGLDVMCMMLQIPQTAEMRASLRIELNDYLLGRLETPWMHDLMAVTCEVDAADVALARKCGLIRTTDDSIVLPKDGEPIPIIEDDSPTAAGDEAHDKNGSNEKIPLPRR